MPLFGRHSARNDMANVTPRGRGWALFSPYPQRTRNRTNPNNNTYTTTTRRTFKGRSANDATRDPRSRRIGGLGARTNEAQRVPLVTKVKRTLGIQTQGRLPAGRTRGGGLFSTTPRTQTQRNRGWFSRSGGRYRT